MGFLPPRSPPPRCPPPPPFAQRPCGAANDFWAPPTRARGVGPRPRLLGGPHKGARTRLPHSGRRGLRPPRGLSRGPSGGGGRQPQSSRPRVGSRAPSCR
eukprot:2348233-Pyramimonas_sp.AAC.1